MIIKKGVAASSGIAIGKCYLVDRNKVFITGYAVTDVESEIKKLKDAVNYTSGALDRLQYSNISGKINTELYDAYKMLLEDELFIGEAQSIIKTEKVNAEYALKKVRDNIINTMLASDNEYLRDRLYDIEHIYQRMQRHMSNLTYDELDEASENSIIISYDLAASDVEIMQKKGIKGFATTMGTKNSHNTIVAKSAGIACVVGVDSVYESVSDGETVIVDGFLGQVIISPNEETLYRYQKKMDEYEKFLSSFNKAKDVRCVSKNGQEIDLCANIESNDEITLIDVHGLNGIGLYRTEFIFMNTGNISEEVQYRIYYEAANRLKGKRLVLRSCDLGGDKLSRHMVHPDEENPAMGLRAIRYSLQYREFFRMQLRAILRVAADYNVCLLLPMVSSVDELLDVKTIISGECDKLKKDNINHNGDLKLGIMVELPSTAMSINKFIPYVDFFSIGTNDLIQYILGVDRNNEHVSHIFSPAHHSVITILSKVYDDVSKAGKQVSICGEMAGDCRYTAMLLGMGYRSFSMNPRASYIVRKIVSKLDTDECCSLVKDMLDAPTTKEAEDILTKFNNIKTNNIYM